MDDKELLKHFQTLVESFGPLMDNLAVEMKEREAEAIRLYGPKNAFLKKRAEDVFLMDGVECWIAKSLLWSEYEKMVGLSGRADETLFSMCGYSGYVCFKGRPVIEPDYEGILSYIPVFGGITYCHHDIIGSVYGFDTSHHGAERHPIRDKEWTRSQIDIMSRGILYASSIEEAYLKADGDNDTRAALLEPIAALVDGPIHEKLGMGGLIKLLWGEL